VRQLCGTVLKMLEHVPGGTAAAVGFGIAVLAIGIAGLIGRPRMGWALYAGSALQLLVIVCGILIPAMYVLGVIFAALWFTGIYLARRVAQDQTR
jgi:hypothetical protein